MTPGLEGALFVADSAEATDVERVLAAEVRRLRLIEQRAREVDLTGRVGEQGGHPRPRVTARYILGHRPRTLDGEA